MRARIKPVTLPLQLTAALLVTLSLAVVAAADDPSTVNGNSSKTSTTSDVVLAVGSEGAPLSLGLDAEGALVRASDSGAWSTLDDSLPTALRSLAWAPDHAQALAVGDGGSIVQVTAEGKATLVPISSSADLAIVSWAPAAVPPYALIGGSGSTLLKYTGPQQEVVVLAVGSTQDGAFTSIDWKGDFALITDHEGGTSLKVELPNVRPTVTITTPLQTDTAHGLVVVRGSASDPDGAVALVEVSVDSSGWSAAEGTTSWSLSAPLPLEEGAHSVSARSFDGEEYSPVSTVALTVAPSEGSAPTVRMTSPDEGSLQGQEVLVLGTAADADGDQMQVQVRIDEGQWTIAEGMTQWSVRLRIGGLLNGQHVLSARAFDGDRFGPTDQRAIMVFNRNLAPIVNIEEPAHGSHFSSTDSVVLDASGSYDPEGIPLAFSWESSIDGALAAEEVASVDLSPGDHVLTLVVSDGSSWRRAEVDVHVEQLVLQLPDVQLLAPHDADRVRGTVTVTGTADHPLGEVVIVEVAVDEGTWRSTSASPFWTYRLDTSQLAPGWHTLHIRGTSDSGQSPTQNVRLWVLEPSAVATPTLRAPPTPLPSAPQSPPMVTVVAAGGVLVALVVLLAAFVEAVRLPLLQALWVPLYSRMNQGEVLDNFTRGSIFGFIVANPGAHFNLIKEELHLNNGSILYHLDILEKEEFVHSTRSGVFRRFYARNVRPQGEEVLSDLQQRLLAALEGAPGTSQADLARSLGLTARALNHHVKVLLRRGMVRLERAGRTTRCYGTAHSTAVLTSDQ